MTARLCYIQKQLGLTIWMQTIVYWALTTCKACIFNEVLITHLTVTSTLWVWYCHPPHFTEEDTEVQRSQRKWQSQLWTQGIELFLPDSAVQRGSLWSWHPYPHPLQTTFLWLLTFLSSLWRYNSVGERSNRSPVAWPALSTLGSGSPASLLCSTYAHWAHMWTLLNEQTNNSTCHQFTDAS